MHAVVVTVTINDFETARPILENEVVPRVSSAPGFGAGYWTRSEDGATGWERLSSTPKSQPAKRAT